MVKIEALMLYTLYNTKSMIFRIDGEIDKISHNMQPLALNLKTFPIKDIMS